MKNNIKMNTSVFVCIFIIAIISTALLSLAINNYVVEKNRKEGLVVNDKISMAYTLIDTNPQEAKRLLIDANNTIGFIAGECLE